DIRARTHPRLARAPGIHRRSRRGDAPPPRSHAGREPARRARAPARLTRAGCEHRSRVCGGRRRQGARVGGPRASPPLVVRGDDARREPGRRPVGHPRKRARPRDPRRLRLRSVLTRRGWSFVGAAVGLYLGARLLGLVQLAVLGVATMLLLIGAYAWV